MFVCRIYKMSFINKCSTRMENKDRKINCQMSDSSLWITDDIIFHSLCMMSWCQNKGKGLFNGAHTMCSLRYMGGHAYMTALWQRRRRERKLTCVWGKPIPHCCLEQGRHGSNQWDPLREKVEPGRTMIDIPIFLLTRWGTACIMNCDTLISLSKINKIRSALLFSSLAI